MTAWEKIIGHDWAVELLAGTIAHERVGHAYLITGPGQVGKTMLARTFAMALNCLDPVPARRPCGRCRACRLIAANRHPDVRLLLPETSGRGKQLIKIDPVRQLQQDLNLTANEARYKVAILKQFDAANASAANAFLKTLEEPPRNVILLLTATNADDLLPTIRSRCRTVALRPLPASLIEQTLLDRDLPPADARLLAHLANGRLGWAFQAAEEPALLETRQTHLAQLYTALDGNRVARFELADQLAKEAETLPPVLETWLSWWRDLMLIKNGRPNGARPEPVEGPFEGDGLTISNVDQQSRLTGLAGRMTLPQALKSLKQTDRALWQLEHNANTRLVVENLLLVYPLPTGGW